MCIAAFIPADFGMESFSHPSGNFLKAGTASYLSLRRPQIPEKPFAHGKYLINIYNRNEQKSHESRSRVAYSVSQLLGECEETRSWVFNVFMSLHWLTRYGMLPISKTRENWLRKLVPPKLGWHQNGKEMYCPMVCPQTAGLRLFSL